jgi:hypothetical protein
MSDSETVRSNLPVAIEVASARPSLAWSAPTAAFISQLIAARDHMPAQRARRTTSVDRAVGAYHRGASITDRRMPEGYRKTVLA